MLDVMNAEYIKTARSKAFARRACDKAIFRNAACLSLPRSDLPAMLVGGSVIVEQIFTITASAMR
jgi:ABC-type dipeptide/oligopeptide/nickel transport system permease component